MNTERVSSPLGANDFYDEQIDEYGKAFLEAWGMYVGNSVDTFLSTHKISTDGKLFAELIAKEAKAYFSVASEVTAEGFEEYLKNSIPKYGAEGAFVFAKELEQFCDALDEFDFPQEQEWLEKAYADYLGELEDRAYDEAKDDALTT